MAAFNEELLKSVMDRFIDKGLVVGLEQSACAGQFLTQPEVSVGKDGVLLDDLLGDGFCIIGYDCHPQDHLSHEHVEKWKGIGAQVVEISSTACDHRSINIKDRSNAIADWLGERRPAMVLLRPDRFAMSVAGLDNAQPLFSEALAMIS